MQAQSLERLGHDSLDVDGEAAAVDSSWRIHTQLHPEGRNAECLLVEVVKRAHPDVARLRAIVDLVRVGRQRRADADLEVRERSVQQLDGKEPTIRATALERETGACLDGDLPGGNRIGVVESEWAPLVEILVIDGSGGARA